MDTYQDYLKRWEKRFGNDTFGRVRYWRYGKEYQIPVARLHEDGWRRHFESWKSIMTRIDEIRSMPEYKVDELSVELREEEENLFAESLIHEIVLFY